MIKRILLHWQNTFKLTSNNLTNAKLCEPIYRISVCCSATAHGNTGKKAYISYIKYTYSTNQSIIKDRNRNRKMKTIRQISDWQLWFGLVVFALLLLVITVSSFSKLFNATIKNYEKSSTKSPHASFRRNGSGTNRFIHIYIFFSSSFLNHFFPRCGCHSF